MDDIPEVTIANKTKAKGKSQNTIHNILLEKKNKNLYNDKAAKR